MFFPVLAEHTMAADPFGRAVRDHYEDAQTSPLYACDGPNVQEHPIEEFYFESFPDTARAEWLIERLDGPLLDIGAGAGKHTLYFQEQFETVAVEVSDHLVETMTARGVDDARNGDMFALPDQFARDRFGSVLVNGTQAGLAGSIHGLRSFLTDLAVITRPDATVVLDSYDPAVDTTTELLGYRADPSPGLAHRVFAFEYEETLGPTLLFRLFTPDRLREATVGTTWSVGDIEQRNPNASGYYRAALRKPGTVRTSDSADDR